MEIRSHLSHPPLADKKISDNFFFLINFFPSKSFFLQKLFSEQVFSDNFFVSDKIFSTLTFFQNLYMYSILLFGFSYLFLKLSFTLPHKEKMLWCSYFRFFIKLINFSRCGNFVKKFNFAGTPWKIEIPLENSVGDDIWVIQIHLGG